MTIRVLARVVVERIRHVSIIERFSKSRIGILVKIWSSYHDQVVGIGTNCLDNRSCVRGNFFFPVVLRSAQVKPAVRTIVLGLIVDFKNHIVVAAPFLSHIAKERLCITRNLFCAMTMEIDNHIDVVFNGSRYHRIHQVPMEIRIRKIVPVPIFPVAINTDRTTNQLDVLFFYKS